MRRSLLVALAAFIAVGVAMMASAAANAAQPAITFVAPSPAEGATLAGDAVSFLFTYPKKPNQSKTFVCDLTGPTAFSGPCDPTVVFENGSLSGVSYSGLANGSYTLTVSLVSNGGGGQTSATRHFTVPVPNEIQRVSVSNATGGTFTLTFDGQTTAPIAFNATATQVQAALEALSNIGSGNLSAAGGDLNTAPVDITFIGIYAGLDVQQLTADASALTGTTPTVTISTIQEGGS